MTSLRFSVAIALAIAALFASALAPANAADAFYTRLFERGVRDFELGLTEDANERLRTACFGFLEEPPLLAECLMQLGRAQARAGDSEDLTTTAERLAELEDRFGTYSAFDGDPKAKFETALRGALPEALLARMPLFSHLAAPPPTTNADPQTLSPKQQRKALERRLAADPTDVDAQLSLARLHYAAGKLKSAGALLDQLLATRPDHSEALCLRASIAVARKECPPALDGLDACSALTASDEGAAFVLECLASSGRDAEAVALLESLPSARAESGAVARAARRIAKAAATEEPQTPTTETSAVAKDPAEGEEDPFQEALMKPADRRSPEPPEAVPSPVEPDGSFEERLRLVRQQAEGSTYREELEAALVSASQLANDYPESARAQHLAAQVAYLGAEWQLVLDYFERGGDIPEDQPVLIFYLAVANFELGDRAKAAEILRPALSALPSSSFVDAYLKKILAPDSP